jgi:hypothetical protein
MFLSATFLKRTVGIYSPLDEKMNQTGKTAAWQLKCCYLAAYLSITAAHTPSRIRETEVFALVSF